MNTKIRMVLASVFILSIATIFMVGCGVEDTEHISPVEFANALVLRPINLPTMTNTQTCYELWLIDAKYTMDEDSNSIIEIEDDLSLGKFYWNRQRYEFYNLNGTQIDSNFYTPNGENIYNYTVMALTVEPIEDDGVRANNGLIFDDIEYGQPIEGQFNYFGSFSPSVVMDYGDPMSATYVLRSYSDDGDPDTSPESGVWFHARDVGGDDYRETLSIPGLREDAAFIYEGWIEMPDSFDGPLSTGKFRIPFFEDLSNPYVGTEWYPNTPGEDFITNAPAGVNFPLTLAGEGRVFITIEPYPDLDPDDPFPFTLFEAELPNVEADSTLDTSDNFEMVNFYGYLPKFEASLYTR